MKRIFLLLTCGAILAACTKDVEQSLELTPEQQAAYAKICVTNGATDAGMLFVEVSPAVADQIEQHVTRSGGQSSGIETIDEALRAIRAVEFHRVFPVDPRFEERHREAGLHLWYYASFDEQVSLLEAARKLAMADEVARINYAYTIKNFAEQGSAPMSFDYAATRGEQKLPFNDPLLGEMWHYNNTGSGPVGAVAGADINLFNAWKLCAGDTNNGQDIVVAVLDQPVQYTHPDLEANMWVNPNAEEVEAGLKHGACFDYGGDNNSWDDCSQAFPLNWAQSWDDGGYEYMDHGTHTAGTIAAVNNNGIGIAGIAGGSTGEGGNVKIMSCQIYKPLKRGESHSNISAARAFVWAADRGAVIANNSWGFEDSGIETESAFHGLVGYIAKGIDYFIKYAGGEGQPLKGGLVLFSAGNSGDYHMDGRTVWPAAYQPVLSVAATTANYLPAYYTDYGATWCDLAAPGGDYHFDAPGSQSATITGTGNGCILSTVLDPSVSSKDAADGIIVNGLGSNRDTGYAWMQGTSMACPHVAGIAALGLAHASNLGKSYTVDEYKSLLMSSTNAIEPYLTNANRDLYEGQLGAGNIDALKLLANIAGMPALVIPLTTTQMSVDLTPVLGGTALNSGSNCTIDTTDAKSRLGLAGTKTATRGIWTVMACTKPGAALIDVTAVVAGTTVTQQVLVIAKQANANNGGWL